LPTPPLVAASVIVFMIAPLIRLPDHSATWYPFVYPYPKSTVCLTREYTFTDTGYLSGTVYLTLLRIYLCHATYPLASVWR
jgi:hypothetical protein